VDDVLVVQLDEGLECLTEDFGHCGFVEALVRLLAHEVEEVAVLALLQHDLELVHVPEVSQHAVDGGVHDAAADLQFALDLPPHAVVRDLALVNHLQRADLARGFLHC